MMRGSPPKALSLFLALASLACAATSPREVTNWAPIASGVAGEYPTEVALILDECGGSQVRSVPTTIEHVAGSSSLVVRHAGSTYQGTIASDGRFSTEPATMVVRPSHYVISMTGRFTSTGFTAEVTVVLTNPAHESGCRYLVSWVATKADAQGSRR